MGVVTRWDPSTMAMCIAIDGKFVRKEVVVRSDGDNLYWRPAAWWVIVVHTTHD